MGLVSGKFLLFSEFKFPHLLPLIVEAITDSLQVSMFVEGKREGEYCC